MRESQQFSVQGVALDCSSQLLKYIHGYFLNSFGQRLRLVTLLSLTTVVSACGGGGSDETTVQFSGTAALGAPISDAPVKAICRDGVSTTTTTSSTGTYVLKASGSPPCTLQVTTSNSQIFRSLGLQAGTVNITPLTESIYQLSGGDPSNYPAASIALTDRLRQDFGIALTGDPTTTAFTANGVGHDYLLEQISSALTAVYDPSATTSAGSTLPLASYVVDVKSGIATSARLRTEQKEGQAFVDKLARVLVGEMNGLPEAQSLVIPMSYFDDKPLYVQIVGGSLATIWNWPAKLSNGIAGSTHDFSVSLLKLFVKDPATGKWFAKSPDAWSDVALDSVGVAGAAGSTILSPGPVAGGLCSLYNVVYPGSATGASYVEQEEFCKAAGEIIDVFWGIKGVVKDYTSIAADSKKFVTVWGPRFKNNSTYIMRVARERSLAAVVYRAFDMAGNVKNATDLASINNANLIRTEVIVMLTGLGFDKTEVEQGLPLLPCPAAYTQGQDGTCAPTAAGVVPPPVFLWTLIPLLSLPLVA